MLVLVLCEESQIITKKLRERDIEAYSCDLQYCSGGKPEYHVVSDCLKIKDGNCRIMTQDFNYHYIGKPDVIIAHPPCTYLTIAGANLLFDKNHNIINTDRFHKGLSAVQFFLQIYNTDCDRICIENPIPMNIWNLPKYTCKISPDEYGSKYNKPICLWLKNIPPFEKKYFKNKNALSWVYSPGVYGGKLRSKTDEKIADAIIYNIFDREYIY